MRIALSGLTVLVIVAVGGAAEAQAPPSYKLVRHEEDFRALADPARRTDWLDPLKFIPLSDRPGWFVTLGGEARERVEVFENTAFDAANGTDAFLLQKYMLFADVHLGSRARLFASLKSGLENGRNGGPRPTDEDRLDAHEAFVDVGFGESFTARVGRQEMAFGSQRLVGVRAGPNVRQSFDGVTLVVRPGAWRLDVFASKPVETNVGVFDDVPDHGKTFWGIYAVAPLGALPGANVDLYYLGLDRKTARFDQGMAPELRESVGSRLWKRGPPWDYNVELVYQWGRFGSAPVRAWTVATDTGYTAIDVPGRPRVGLRADVTSGDDDPDGPALRSFNPLFPRGAYFGESQLVGPVNHIDLHPSLDFSPMKNVAAHVSWAFFWRESGRDGIYGVPGNLVRSGKDVGGRFVGSQATASMTVSVGRHVTIASTVERFIAGLFLRQSGNGDDLTFLTTSVGFVF